MYESGVLVVCGIRSSVRMQMIIIRAKVAYEFKYYKERKSTQTSLSLSTPSCDKTSLMDRDM